MALHVSWCEEDCLSPLDCPSLRQGRGWWSEGFYPWPAPSSSLEDVQNCISARYILTIERRDIVVMECTRIDWVDHGRLMATFWLVYANLHWLEDKPSLMPRLHVSKWGCGARLPTVVSPINYNMQESIHKLNSQVDFIAPSPLVYRGDSGPWSLPVWLPASVGVAMSGELSLPT